MYVNSNGRGLTAGPGNSSVLGEDDGRSNGKYRVLIIEDDADLAEITRIHFRREGYVTEVAGSRAAAEQLLSSQEFDLILLDIVLPDARGEDLCRTIRDRSRCPIIFMSCLDDSDTIVSALKSGGDDYMIKPVNYDELMARAEAVIRRSTDRESPDTAIRHYKYFDVDTARHQVLRNGEALELSSTEYSLLETFLKHPGTLLLYSELYKSVWGSDSLGDNRTVMVHISNLRKKLDPGHNGVIQTIRGAGYIFNPF